MARRRRAEKREVLPDAKFSEILVTKFMNVLMYEGKKSVAEHTVYGALEKIQRLAKGANALEIFKQPLWIKSARISKSVPAASAVRPIRCRSKCGRIAATRSLCAGSSDPPRGRSGTHHERPPRWRNLRRCQRKWRCRQEARRHPSHGRSQSRLFTLPLVRDHTYVPSDSHRELSQYRHHGAYRCGENHDH